MTHGPWIFPAKTFTNPLTAYSPGVRILGATGVLLSFVNTGTANETLQSVDAYLDASTAGLGSTDAQASGLSALTDLPNTVLLGFADVEGQSLDKTRSGFVQFVQNVGGVYIPARSVWNWLYLKIAKSAGAGSCTLGVSVWVEYPGDSPLLSPPEEAVLGEWV